MVGVVDIGEPCRGLDNPGPIGVEEFNAVWELMEDFGS
jgi:hypothetical protein